MADRSASVKLGMNPSGFLAGLSTIEGKSVGTAKKIGKAFSSALDGSIKNLAKGSTTAFDSMAKRGDVTAKRLSASFAKVKLGMKSDSMMAGLRDFESKALSTFKRIKSSAGSSLGGIKVGGGGGGSGGVLGGIVGGGMINRGLGKVMGAGEDAIKWGFGLTHEAEGVRDKANRISINGRAAGKEFANPDELYKKFFETAKDNKGITADSAADAAAKFVELTGDLDTVMKNMDNVAKGASASGADMADVASTTASLAKAFGITDPEDVKQVIAALHFGGKQGAMPFESVAKVFQTLAASGGAFGLSHDVKGVKTLAGLTQVARTGSGSGEEASTSVQAVLRGLTAHATQLEGLGVKVFNRKTGAAEDLPTVLAGAIAKVGGMDMGEKRKGLSKMFSARGYKSMAPLLSTFTNSYASAGGSDDNKLKIATEAVRQAIETAANAAGDWSELLKDSAQAQSTTSAKTTAALEELKGKLGDALLPKIAELVDSFTETDEPMNAFITVMTAATDAIGWFADFLNATGLVKKKSGLSVDWIDNTDPQHPKKSKWYRQDIGEDDEKNLKIWDTMRAAQYDAKENEKKNKEAEASLALGKESAALYGPEAAGTPMQKKAEAPKPANNGRVHIDNEVRVRVVNASELFQKSGSKGGAGGTKGWLPK
jgi:TP901 family phage tail tape measure protein